MVVAQHRRCVVGYRRAGTKVRDWLEQLPALQFAVAVFYVDLVADRGLLLGEPYTRQLDGKLRELRFHLDGRVVRVTDWIASVGGSCC